MLQFNKGQNRDFYRAGMAKMFKFWSEGYLTLVYSGEGLFHSGQVQGQVSYSMGDPLDSENWFVTEVSQVTGQKVENVRLPQGRSIPLNRKTTLRPKFPR